jgi:hypothetical protein
MIPKIIHYAWFGDQSKKPIERINRWKEILPDYEFMEYTEKSPEVNISKYSWCYEAYKRKKYAICTDPLRIEVLYKYGGIWLDTDVEVYQKLDSFLNYSLFSGYAGLQEKINDLYSVVGLYVLGSCKNMPLLKNIIEYRNNKWNNIPKNISEDNFTYIQEKYYHDNLPLICEMKKLYNFWKFNDKAITIETEDGKIRFEESYTFTKKEDGYDNYTQHLFDNSWIIK